MAVVWKKVAFQDDWVGNAASQWKFVTSGATPFAAVWSDFSLKGTTGGTVNFAVTAAKTLTLTAVNDWNLTIPATGTVALLGTANLFTANQTITGNLLFSCDAVPTTRDIKVNDQTTNNKGGNFLRLFGGAGLGSGVGGNFEMAGGAGGATGKGGNLVFAGGPGGVTSGAGGDISFSGGVPGGGVGNGKILLYTGTSGFAASLDAASIAASDKTFTFPNVSGTFALGADTLTSVTTNDVTVANHTHAITAAVGLIGNAASQWKFVTSGANPFTAVWSDFSFKGTTGGTVNFAVTNAKTLTLTAVDDYNLTIPKTGTAVLGTGAATYIGYFSDADVLTGTSTLAFTAASCLFNVTSPATNVSSTIRMTTINRVGQADTGHDDLQFYDGAAMAFRFLCAVGNNPAGNRYGGFIGYSDRDGTPLPLWFFTADAAGTPQFSIKMAAGQTAGTSGGVTVSGAFGCNAKTPQTAYASGGAVTPGAGAFGFSSAANAAALATLVTNIRAALVANGIMS